MSNDIPPAAVPSRTGCFGKGCTTILGLLVFLAIALIAGTFWGVYYLRGYSAEAPVPIPVVETPVEPESAPVDLAPSATPLPYAVAAPSPTQEPLATPAAVATPAPASPQFVSRDWKSFERAAKRNEPASIELTAGDINALISGSNARGQVFVSIAGDVGAVQVSMPLKNVPMMDGRYLNGTATVESSPDGDPAKARISNIVLNGRPVPDSFIDQGLLGLPSLRTVIKDWLNDQNIGSFRIEDNRVRGTTRAGGG